MSTLELRKKVLERLESVDEAHILEEILGLLDIESNDRILPVPDHFKQKLEKSIAQKKAGNTISNKAVEDDIEKWLYK